MFPTMYVLVANWFPAAERGRASSVFTFYQTLAPLIMSPVSGLILSIGWFGMAGWRWLFILEALPGIVFALVLYFVMADNPQSEKKLKPANGSIWYMRLQRKLQNPGRSGQILLEGRDASGVSSHNIRFFWPRDR